MSFSTYSNDFYDFNRFFCDEVINKTDFFKETIVKISQEEITKKEIPFSGILKNQFGR